MFSFSDIYQQIHQNWLELTAVLAGFFYLYCSIKQYITLWIWGVISSLLYIYIFYQARFYAGAFLQIYYVAISFYGYAYWYIKRNKSTENTELNIQIAGFKKLLFFVGAIILLTTLIGFLLKQYTNSYVPFSDAFTFAGGLIATWMLARKYIEQWLFWIVIDCYSVVLYSIQHLYLTAILYFVYFVMAIVGYYEWKKSITLK